MTTDSSTEIPSLNLQTEDEFSKPATEVTTALEPLAAPVDDLREAMQRTQTYLAATAKQERKKSKKLQ